MVYATISKIPKKQIAVHDKAKPVRRKCLTHYVVVKNKIYIFKGLGPCLELGFKPHHVGSMSQGQELLTRIDVVQSRSLLHELRA